MINVQTLVDNAISANLEEYKKEAERYYLYKKVSERSKTKKDIRDFKNYATVCINTFNAIEDTLIRLFPDFEDYINNRLTEARIEVKKK